MHRLAEKVYNSALAITGTAALSVSVVFRNHMKAAALGQMVVYDDAGETPAPRASAFLGAYQSISGELKP